MSFNDLRPGLLDALIYARKVCLMTMNKDMSVLFLLPLFFPGIFFRRWIVSQEPEDHYLVPALSGLMQRVLDSNKKVRNGRHEEKG